MEIKIILLLATFEITFFCVTYLWQSIIIIYYICWILSPWYYTIPYKSKLHQNKKGVQTLSGLWLCSWNKIAYILDYNFKFHYTDYI